MGKLILASFFLVWFLLPLAGDDCSVDQEEGFHCGLYVQESMVVGGVGQLLQTVGEGGPEGGQDDGQTRTQDTTAAQAPPPWGWRRMGRLGWSC